ncbi:hypothetical protein [Stieleria varia]|uniref:Uncharacterized protein n=1 Tax=Stieleria varia TaxID=2528005 RepID=A0A5C6AWA4_9BACT|nr:hypothetical protein [Stieleria varia]TWU04223.1 hypothetical protein Pla52n_22620 [Stieleria varia]
MALTRSTFAAVGLFFATLATPSFADTYHHIDEVAVTIERQARLIVEETRHYIHTPEYRHLVSDAQDMCRLASHMHEVAHHHGSLAHLESDLRQLDAEFHHLEGLFDRIEIRAAHGQGHIHGGTGHVRSLLDSIEDNIHHLQDDVRSLRNPHFVARPVIVPQPIVYPRHRSTTIDRFHDSHDHGHGHQGYRSHHSGSFGRGITIGGGSSRFTIRF